MNQSTRVRPAHRQIRFAAVLMLVQGILMEGLPFLALPALLFLGVNASVLSHGFSFVVPFFNEHLYLMMAMSGVFGALRVVGAVGLLKNRLWGYWFSVVSCSVTLVLMVFMMPAGIADGLLSGAALLLLFIAKYGDAPIENRVGPAASESPLPK